MIKCVLSQQYDPLDVKPDTTQYSFTKNEKSPIYRVQVITAASPYNTNQNTLDLEYYSTYNKKRDLLRLYVTLTLKVDQPDVGSDVFMYFSLQPSTETNWDIGRCRVKYDGDVNLPIRYYNVTDHWSEKRPYYGGLDLDLPLDKY